MPGRASALPLKADILGAGQRCPLPHWLSTFGQLIGSHRGSAQVHYSKHHSLMACCASSRPLLDRFFSRSAASSASRRLRKRSVFWARSSRSSSCSSFNERFVGALGFFSVASCSRFVG